MPPKRKRSIKKPIASEGDGTTTGFPALREGLSAPKGTYLNIKTTASEGGRSYMSRSGFVKLATSEQFVRDLRRDVEQLYSTVWLEFQQRSASESENVSALACFQHHFRRQGWHRAQFFWSEHEGTRQAMYDTVIRVFCEPLRCVADANSRRRNENHELALTDRQVFYACISLFSAHAFQSTTVLSSRDSKMRSVQKPRVRLEADMFAVLPNIAPLMQGRFSQESIDEATFLLRTMLGAQSDGDESVFDVMLPSAYRARPPLVDNTFTSKGDLQRESKPAGRLVNEKTGATQPLSTGDLGLAMVRQALNMPLTFDDDRTILRLEKEQVRNRWTSLGNAMVSPFIRHVETHDAATEAASSAGRLVTQKRRDALGKATLLDADFIDNIRTATSASDGVHAPRTAIDVETLVERPTITLREILQHSRDCMLDRLVQHVRESNKTSPSM